LLVFGAAVAYPQSVTNTFSTNINGNRVEAPSQASADGERTERFQSINGRQVPLEQIVERVVSQDANGKVTERIVRRFDQTGRPVGTERTRVEENKLPGGGSSVRETTYRDDVNGAFHEAERRTVETRPQGSTTNTSTVIDRPTLNGSFETVEKRSAVTEGPATNQRTTESVFRPSGAGGFQETLRYVTTSSKSNDTSTETTLNYEPGVTGQLRLASKNESTTTKRPDGTEVIQSNSYAYTVVGRLEGADRPLRVIEQDIVERRPKPDGSFVETFNLRRPTISDPNRLGELQKVSETICKGKCLPEPKPAEPPKPAPAKP
jgi:hypothetical protein